MVGAFITRGLIMVFGYSYPAYECYKTVEKNKVDIEELLFWCQYWILVALLTVFEFGDTLISWVPMYMEAKLAFFIYLWCPKTKGATYVYDSFLRPHIAKHEKDIDRNLLELRTRAADITVLYLQKAATYCQTRVFEILQYFASQSTPKPRTEQKGAEARQVPPTVQPQPQQPASRTTSTSKTQLQAEAIEEAVPPPAPTSATPAQTTPADQPSKEVTSQNKQIEAEEMQEEPVLSASNRDVNPSQPKETTMEEVARGTRRGLRKRRATENR